MAARAAGGAGAAAALTEAVDTITVVPPTFSASQTRAMRAQLERTAAVLAGEREASRQFAAAGAVVIGDTIIPSQFWEELYIAQSLYRSGDYTKEDYNFIVRRIVGEAKKKNKEEGARLAAEALAREKGKTEAAAARRAAARGMTKVLSAAAEGEYASFVIPVGTATNDAAVYQIARRVVGPTILRAVFPPSEGAPKGFTYSFENPPDTASLTHHILLAGFYYPEGSDNPSIFEGWAAGGVEILWPAGQMVGVRLYRPSATLTPQTLTQAFADGKRHCVISPLIAAFEKALCAAESVSTEKRLKQRINALKKLETKYSNGVPEGDCMEEVARIAGRKIVIHDVLDNEYQTYYATCQKTFHFTNTRENHLDEGHLCVADKPERVSRDRMDALLADHRARGVFHMTEGLFEEVRCLRSAEGAWRCMTELQELYEEHNAENRLTEYGLNATRHPEANKWLRAAVIVNSAPVVLNPDLKPTLHDDLTAAYTQFKTTPRYVGFMGKIHQWRRFPDLMPITEADFAAIQEFVRQYPHAIYKFEVIHNPNTLLQQLGLRDGGKHTLPGPELLMYMELGLRVKLLAGVFGSRCDLSFSEQMIAKPHKAYQKWCGCLGHDNPNKKLTFSGSSRWADHLAALLGKDNVWFNKELGLISILRQNDNYWTTHHLFAFITGYTRMVMMEQMLRLRPGSIRKVVLDAIYHDDETVEFDARWNQKPIPLIIRNTNTTWGWFPPHEMDDTWMPVLDNDGTKKLRNCVLSGAGGTGKTHSVLTDTGFNDIVYVSPTHQQGQAMSQKYGVRYKTIHKMIGVEGCVPYCKEHASPFVIVPDEITMYGEGWMDKLLELYPQSLILPAGDIVRLPDGRVVPFQCRTGKPGMFPPVWKAEQVDNWLHFDTDYRAKDEELKALKTAIRGWMRDHYTDGEAGDALELAMWVYDNYKHRIVKFDEAVKMFENGTDTWIAALHYTNKRLLKNGVVSGYQTKDGQKSKTELKDGEKRGSFTTHGFQGQTITDGRVFISLTDGFEIAMLYTAISRAVNISQIVLVE